VAFRMFPMAVNLRLEMHASSYRLEAVSGWDPPPGAILTPF